MSRLGSHEDQNPVHGGRVERTVYSTLGGTSEPEAVTRPATTSARWSYWAEQRLQALATLLNQHAVESPLPRDSTHSPQSLPQPLESLGDLQHAVRALLICLELFPETRSLAALRSQVSERLDTTVSASALPPVLDQLGLQPERFATLAANRQPDDFDPLGYEALLCWELQPPEPEDGSWRIKPSLHRRRGGSHYTPAALTHRVVQAALAPLLAGVTTQAQILALTVCDPACGAGALLAAARDQLAEHLLNLPGAQPLDPAHARALVVKHCLRGVDQDPTALVLCGYTLNRSLARSVNVKLALGDALLGEVHGDPPANLEHSVDWHNHFPEAFDRQNPGFDLVIGNPPWVAYVGRAAQPLAKSRAAYFKQHYRSFSRYRTLHGLFVERATQLLRLGGRLAFILPTSVADLAGYAPTRAAHDEHCTPDPELLDFGDGAFQDVFQPCMALLSTRESEPKRQPREQWLLPRADLSSAERALLHRLSELESCPKQMFGERGYQTTTQDRAQLEPFTQDKLDAGLVPLLTGTEVLEYERLPARLCAPPAKLSTPLRSASQWQQIAVLVRQTARFPIAALSDGCAFRNSLIAGFETPAHTRYLMLAYLNSTPVRWLHYQRFRDARQGMPQLKVGHLRALPLPPALESACGAQLHEWGQRLGERNRGISTTERAAIDPIVGQAWSLSADELALIAAWGLDNPAPSPRSRSRSGGNSDT